MGRLLRSSADTQFNSFSEVGSDQFKERAVGSLTTSYLISAAPSLGVGLTGAPIVGAGTNDGAIVLEHSSGTEGYSPSAYLLPGTGGHADVVRCMYHAVEDQALYTGSEDGVLAGWALSGLKLAMGVDGEGEENEENEDGGADSGMEVDGEEEERERRKRERRDKKEKKEKRREKRHAPY